MRKLVIFCRGQDLGCRQERLLRHTAAPPLFRWRQSRIRKAHIHIELDVVKGEGMFGEIQVEWRWSAWSSVKWFQREDQGFLGHHHGLIDERV